MIRTETKETVYVGTTKINRTISKITGTSGKVNGCIKINHQEVPVTCNNFRMFPRVWCVVNVPVIVESKAR